MPCKISCEDKTVPWAPEPAWKIRRLQVSQGLQHMTAALELNEIEQKVIDDLGLRRIDTSELTIERVRASQGFRFVREGKRAVGRRDVKRIVELVIPPAWSEVRIASDKDCHLQAVGRDEAGRLQYIYHSAWEDVRAAAKAFRLQQMGLALPNLRPAVEEHLKTDGAHLPLAAAARLVDLLHLRAGHETYAGDEGGRGVATLLKRHVQIDGASFRLNFRGKGGKRIDKTHTDPALAEVLAELRRIRGARVFKLTTKDGYRPMTAADLNAYLTETSGKTITAKDFRTLFASAEALDRLCSLDTADTAAKRRGMIAEIAREISLELANTPAITRKSYIHPLIISKFESCELDGFSNARTRAGLTPAESRLMRFLETHANDATQA
jgi:DNA topoisomerase I